MCQKPYKKNQAMLECSQAEACISFQWYHARCLATPFGWDAVALAQAVSRSKDSDVTWLCPACDNSRKQAFAPAAVLAPAPPAPAPEPAPAGPLPLPAIAAPEVALVPEAELAPPAPAPVPAPCPVPEAALAPAAAAPPAPPARHAVDVAAQFWDLSFRSTATQNKGVRIRQVSSFDFHLFPRLDNILSKEPNPQKSDVIKYQCAQVLAAFYTNTNDRLADDWDVLEALSILEPDIEHRARMKHHVTESVTTILNRYPIDEKKSREYGDTDDLLLAARLFFDMKSSDRHYAKPAEQPLCLYYGLMLDSDYRAYAFFCLHCLRLLLVTGYVENLFSTTSLRLTERTSGLADEVVFASLQLREAPRSDDIDFGVLLPQLRKFKRQQKQAFKKRRSLLLQVCIGNALRICAQGALQAHKGSK